MAPADKEIWSISAIGETAVRERKIEREERDKRERGGMVAAIPRRRRRECRSRRRQRDLASGGFAVEAASLLQEREREIEEVDVF
ncbi:hypothetical protein ACLB2K_002969 [Fragaria x ananassa]